MWTVGARPYIGPAPGSSHPWCHCSRNRSGTTGPGTSAPVCSTASGTRMNRTYSDRHWHHHRTCSDRTCSIDPGRSSNTQWTVYRPLPGIRTSGQA